MSDTLLSGEAPTNEPTDNTPSFQWATDVAGSGEAPSYFKADKYDTVADQAAAYPELERKFGGFTGAPESYSLPEELNGEEAFVQKLMEVGKTANMNQDTFSSILELSDTLLEAQTQVNAEQEMEKLGSSASDRLDGVGRYLASNLGAEKYDKYKDLINSALAVEFMEDMIALGAPAKLPTGQDVTTGKPTQEEIEKLMTETDESGRVIYSHSESRQKLVAEMFEQMLG